MSTVRIRIKDEVAKRLLREMGAKAARAMEESLYQAAFLIQGEAKQLIARGSKSGKKYRRKGVVHQASKKGEAPATDEGTLLSKIMIETQGSQSVIVGAAVNYGGYLEEGTSRMDPRPFMRPALENKKPEIEQMVGDILEFAIE